jgi:hypothetical protein
MANGPTSANHLLMVRLARLRDPSAKLRMAIASPAIGERGKTSSDF